MAHKNEKQTKARVSVDSLASCSVAAEINTWLGRHYLKVNGVTLAMEGDLCRDANIREHYWTLESLTTARDTILLPNELAETRPSNPKNLKI